MYTWDNSLRTLQVYKVTVHLPLILFILIFTNVWKKFDDYRYKKYEDYCRMPCATMPVIFAGQANSAKNNDDKEGYIKYDFKRKVNVQSSQLIYTRS